MEARTIDQEAPVKPKKRSPDDPFEAIARGETAPSRVHDSVREEEAVLDIEDFNLWYGDAQALYDVAMGIPKGKVTALIGPSGCGKSTLLRSVNRLNDRATGDKDVR